MTGRNPDSEARRPLLAGGEGLREDTERGGGGGPKFHPFTTEETFERLGPLARSIAEESEQLPDHLAGRHVVFELTLLPNYLATSYFPTELLAEHDLYSVGSRKARGVYRTKTNTKADEPTRTILVAGEKDSIGSLARTVEGGPSEQKKRVWEDLRRLDVISMPRPDQIVKPLRKVVGEGEVIAWEAVISPIGHDPIEKRLWGDEAFEKLVAWVEQLGGKVDADYRRFVGDLSFVPLLINPEEIEEVSRFNLLRSIRPMPGIRPTPGPVIRVVGGGTSPPVPSPDSAPASDFRVAVFDGGLDSNNRHFEPFVTSVDLTPESAQPDFANHGSMVTSTILFGHLDSTMTGSLPTPTVGVDHFRVLPVPPAHEDHYAYWILDRICETLQSSNHKIVNLSLGPDEPIDDSGEPNRWTAELDCLAVERGITFVNAVGNNGLEDAALGFNRIQIPADMIHGVSVGAAKEVDGCPTRAEYSAVGPGREGQRMQPLGVAFGGSSPAQPFVALERQGHFAQVEGTSFATPLVSRGLGELAASVDAHRQTPQFLRAAAAHFASRGKSKDAIEEIGLGRLRDSFDDIWDCEPNECTLIYEDVLNRSGVVAMRIPFPDGLPDGSRYQIRWTFAFTTETDPKEPSEYSLSGLEVTFRPHERVRVLNSEGKLKKVNLDTDSDLIEESVAQGASLSEVPASDSGWRKPYRMESLQRQAGKWETIVCGHSGKKGSSLSDPRLDVSFLRRDGTGLINSTAPQLPVVLFVTVKAPKNVDLYDRVRSQYRILAPLTRIHIPVPGVA